MGPPSRLDRGSTMPESSRGAEKALGADSGPEQGGGGRLRATASTSTTDSSEEDSDPARDAGPGGATPADRLAADLVQLSVRTASAPPGDAKRALEAQAGDIVDRIRRLREAVAKQNRGMPNGEAVIDDASDDLFEAPSPDEARETWKDGKDASRAPLSAPQAVEMFQTALAANAVPESVAGPGSGGSVASEITMDCALRGLGWFRPPPQRSWSVPLASPVPPPPPPRRRASAASSKESPGTPPDAQRKKPLPKPSTLPPPPLTPIVDVEKPGDIGKGKAAPAPRRRATDTTQLISPGELLRSGHDLDFAMSCPENLARDAAQDDGPAKPSPPPEKDASSDRPRGMPRKAWARSNVTFADDVRAPALPREPPLTRAAALPPSPPTTKRDVTTVPKKARPPAKARGDASKSSSLPSAPSLRRTKSKDKSIHSHATGSTAASSTGEAVEPRRPFDAHGRCPRHPSRVVAQRQVLGGGNTKATNRTKGSGRTKSSVRTMASANTQGTDASSKRMQDLSHAAAAFVADDATGNGSHRPHSKASRPMLGRWKETKEAPEPTKPRKNRWTMARLRGTPQQPRSSRRAAAERAKSRWFEQSIAHGF
ncbi:hypothetical protein ACHAXT_011126 [Thalassiosira profunda]